MGKRTERERTQPRPRDFLGQEILLYELRKDSKSIYGPGSLSEGQEISSKSIGLYRSGGLGEKNLYSAAKEGMVYGASANMSSRDGIDKNGKIMKKFVWD